MENEWTELKYLYDKAIGDLVKCSLLIKELEAENRRLVALNDTFPPEIARLEDRVSEEYEAERADDRARIKELEAERDADRKREYGYSQQTVDALTLERDRLTAENKRLRELVDGARVIVEVFQWSTPAQERWREEWLKKAAKAMKETSHE